MRIWAAILPVLLTSCSSVSIQNEHWAKVSNSHPSYLIKVESPAHSETLTPAQTPIEDTLAGELALALQPHQPAYWTRDSIAQIQSHKTPHYIVHVNITKQDPGSRLLRSLIGWGAGGTKLETKTSITKPNKSKSASSLTTTGGSGAMPGALFTDPFMFLPAAAVLAGTTGLSYDARRTAKTIAKGILINHAKIHNIKPPKRTSDNWLRKVVPYLRQTNSKDHEDFK